MKFTLDKDIITKVGKPITWVEAGIYDVVRMFDKDRVLVHLSTSIIGKRQLTVIPIYKGTLSM